MSTLDVIIKDAFVLDGTGRPAFNADVGICGSEIKEVGPCQGQEARETINGRGLIVAPGFIDLHCHADFSLPVLPTADSLVRQGITTAVVGQCGQSPAPLFEWNRQIVIESYAAMIDGWADKFPWSEWNSYAEYLSYLQRIKTSINIIPLVGHGTIRAGVMGFAASKPTSAQMKAMQAEAEKAVEEGALGLSTGLIYPPGSYASTDELVRLCKAIAKVKAIYFSHIRGEGETLIQALKEALSIARQTGVSVQISHFKAAGVNNWPRSMEALDLIDRARTEGLDVSVDMYPYTAGNAGLATFLPEWALEGGPWAALQRLNDPKERGKMREDMRLGGFAQGTDWSKVLIVRASGRDEYEGEVVSSLAAWEGKDVFDWIFDALSATNLRISMITFAMSKDNRRREMTHPAMFFGTDGMGLSDTGPMSAGLPHPRSFGTFPLILGRHVREEGTLSLEEAVHKMTGLAASRLGLKNRGLVRRGLSADLVVFDPDKVQARSTYRRPTQYPVGINHVLVNGQLVVSDGRHTQARPGVILRRSCSS